MGTRMDSMSARPDRTDKTVQDLASRTSALERGGVNGSAGSTAGDLGGTRGSGTGGHPGNPYSRGPSGVPQTRRQTVVVGGFPIDTDKATILTSLRSFIARNQAFLNWPGPDLVEDYFTPGPFASIGKIKFRSSDNRWNFSKPSRGANSRIRTNSCSTRSIARRTNGS